MPDITVEQLAAALEGLKVTVIGIGSKGAASAGEHYQEWACGVPRWPAQLAEILHRELCASAASREPEPDDGTVPLTMRRDDLLQVLGWVQAHRPLGDWEPGFLTVFLRAVAEAVKPGAR